MLVDSWQDSKRTSATYANVFLFGSSVNDKLANSHFSYKLEKYAYAIFAFFS